MRPSTRSPSFSAERILFFKFGAMGDVLMTTPLVRQVRRIFPSARIDYLVGAPFAAAIEGNPWVDEVRTFDESIFTRLRALPWLRLIGDLRRRRYDLVFVLDKHWSFPLTARLAGIPHRVGFVRDAVSRRWLNHRAAYGGVRHEVLCYLDLLEAVGQKPDEQDVQMEFGPGRKDTGKVPASFPDLAQPYVVCVNSGGLNVRERGGQRRLPDAFFRSLVERLAEQGQVVLLGSGEDAAKYATLPPLSRCLNLAGKTTLAETMAILRTASRVYCTDCGVMHLAAAAGTKSVCAFFGPTHPQRKAPLTGEVEIIWTDSAIYEPGYEDRGTPPTAEFFQHLNLELLKHHFAGPPLARS